MQVHAAAMPRQGDIAAMGIHARRCQHMGTVDRHALSLVHGRSIAMVDVGIVLQVETYRPAIIDAQSRPGLAVAFRRRMFPEREHARTEHGA